jgi:aminoglycoside phosphotransferase (APT) family kinase protein
VEYTTGCHDAMLREIVGGLGGLGAAPVGVGQHNTGQLVVERLHGGSVNLAYRVTTAGGADVVVRLPVDRLRENEFPVEAWATAAAAAAGLPVAAVLGTGLWRDVPYLVSRFVPSAAEEVAHPWTRLGTYARAIGGIPLDDAPPSLYSRFGADPAAAWASHVRYNLAALDDDDDPLLRDGAYASGPRLRGLLRPLAATVFDFGLAHGDLAPRNLVSRGAEVAPVLIDWGGAKVGPTPWTDAQRVFEWAHVERSITGGEFAEFAAAAGVGTREDRRVLLALTALEVVDSTRWARDRRLDLYPAYVTRCRAALHTIGAD